MASKSEMLKYMPFGSSVDVGFWFELAKKKLDVLKLDERELPVTGFFGLATNSDPPARFNLESSSFDADFKYAFLVVSSQRALVEVKNITNHYFFQNSAEPLPL
jgi:hypothetical protein